MFWHDGVALAHALAPNPPPPADPAAPPLPPAERVDALPRRVRRPVGPSRQQPPTPPASDLHMYVFVSSHENLAIKKKAYILYVYSPSQG